MEAVPLSHRIHPRGVCLVEAVCFVLVALDTETTEGQRTSSRDRPRWGNECSGLLRTDRQDGEPGVGKNRRQGSRPQEEWTGTARLKEAVVQGGDGLSTPSRSFMQPLRRVGKDSSPHFTDERTEESRGLAPRPVWDQRAPASWQHGPLSLMRAFSLLLLSRFLLLSLLFLY